MSLSRHIQTADLLKNIRGKISEELKTLILARGNDWYTCNPDETARIKQNLTEFGIPCTADLLQKIIKNTILHYYEKLLPLCGEPKYYYEFLKERVDLQEATLMLQESTSTGKGILIAISHFGAVEFLAPALAMQTLPLNTVLRFTTEQFSRMAHKQAEALYQSGFFGPIRFIEIGKPGTVTALEMAAVLRRKEFLVSVFDEKTEYSKPVSLLGKQVYGGAGLDRLVAFANTPVDIFTAFMVRCEQDHYKLVLHKIDQPTDNLIQQMYNHLESMVRKYCEQWYFLHEEIPFVETNTTDAISTPGTH